MTTYKIQRHVEVEHIRRGLWRITCQNRRWETTNERDAVLLRRWIQEQDCASPIAGLAGPVRIGGKPYYYYKD